MYAVIMTGGKQYRVAAGERIHVESIEGEPGSSVTLDRVLLIGEGADVTVGTPIIEGSQVSAKILSQGKHRKINVLKFKRRQGYLRNKGHRQRFTELEITDIKKA